MEGGHRAAHGPEESKLLVKDHHRALSLPRGGPPRTPPGRQAHCDISKQHALEARKTEVTHGPRCVVCTRGLAAFWMTPHSACLSQQLAPCTRAMQPPDLVQKRQRGGGGALGSAWARPLPCRVALGTPLSRSGFWLLPSS